jgi:hypothetical protein
MKEISSCVSGSVRVLKSLLNYSENLKLSRVKSDGILSFVSGGALSLILMEEERFQRVLLSDTMANSASHVAIKSGMLIAAECLDFDQPGSLIISYTASDSGMDTPFELVIPKDIDHYKKRFPNQKGIISRFE